MEEPDSSTVPEHEDEPVTTTPSVSPKPPQQSIIETPLPAPAPLTLTPTPPVLAPSTAKDKESPKPTPSTSKEVVRPVPVSPPKRGEERKPIPITSKSPRRRSYSHLPGGRERLGLHSPPRVFRAAPQRPRQTRLALGRPDEVVDRPLDRAKSPLGEGEAQKVIEVVEKVSEIRLLATYR